MHPISYPRPSLLNYILLPPLLSLLILILVSCNHDFKIIKLFESTTNISLQQYDIEVKSEVITTGAFGSDSYTEYILLFNKQDFKKVLSEIKDQGIISENDRRKNIIMNSGIHHLWVENDINFSFITHDTVVFDNCFTSIEVYKFEQKIVLEDCP